MNVLIQIQEIAVSTHSLDSVLPIVEHNGFCCCPGRGEKDPLKIFDKKQKVLAKYPGIIQ